MKISYSLLLAASALMLSACGKNADPEATTTATTPEIPVAISAIFAQAVAPAAAMSIPGLKSTVKQGDIITIEGKVMGSKEPFLEQRAIVIVGDEATVTSCDLEEGDQCPTPWDACCDAPEVLQNGTATIQIVDAEGKVLKHGLKGISGLKELSRLRVKGSVASDPASGALLVNAEAIELL